MSTSPKTSKNKPASKKEHSLLDDVKARANDRLETFEEKVRQSPDKAVLIALAAGYAVHLLPVGGLIGIPIRLGAFLAKPTLLALGAVKAFEIVQAKARR